MKELIIYVKCGNIDHSGAIFQKKQANRVQTNNIILYAFVHTRLNGLENKDR